MRVTIGKKLSIGYILVLFMMIAMGLSSYFSLSKVGKSTYMVAQHERKKEVVSKLKFPLLEALITNDFLVTGDVGRSGHYEELCRIVERKMNVNGSCPFSDEEKKFLAEIEKHFEVVKAKTDELLRFADTTRNEFTNPRSNRLIEKIDTAAVNVIDNIEALEKLVRRNLSEEITRSERIKLAGTLTIIIISVTAVVIGITAWFISTRAITTPVHSLISTTRIIAKGDLSKKVDIVSEDEIGQLARDFNTMTEELNNKTTSVEKLNKEITERKKMEEALLQSEKLKSIGIITAGVAHEFNNILAIISGNVQLLEGSRKDDEELTNALSTIKRAANDGAEISRRMLKFTKTAKDMTGFVSFDINELINQAIDFTMPRWKNMAQAKGRNYHMDTEGMKSVPSIMCNPTELREVFVNIIGNALDAMPDDGRITFRTWNGEETVFISISDTGKGMPEEVKKNIFDPFFTTRTPVGTGLGLSTAYGIVTGHDGKMEVESEVGKGSTFTLQFPIATKADSPKELPELEQEIKTNSLCILVVDDEKDICNILKTLFSRDGHDVKTVTSGKEAIKLIKSEKFDLVLSDLVMPGLSGHDVIQAIDELDKRPKVGLITGWKEEIESKDKEELNVDFIIRKPFDLTVLTKQINNLFI